MHIGVYLATPKYSLRTRTNQEQESIATQDT
jgi:hypothetical protein